MCASQDLHELTGTFVPGDDCGALSLVHETLCMTLLRLPLAHNLDEKHSTMQCICSCGACTERRHCQLLAAHAAVRLSPPQLRGGAVLQLPRFLSEPILASAALPTNLHAAANGVHAAVAQPSLRRCSVSSRQVPWVDHCCTAAAQQCQSCMSSAAHHIIVVVELSCFCVSIVSSA